MAGNALYDVALRMRAAELYDEGCGRASVAALIGIPEEAVRKWLGIHRSVGVGGLAVMGAKRSHYPFETKVAAVRAVVGGGMARPEAMARFGIASPSAFKRWLRAYRGGRRGARAEAQGRAEGGSSSPPKAMTREQGPGRRVQRLGAENACLKKIDGPEGGEAPSNRERAAAVSGPSGRHPLAGLLGCAGLARSSCHYAPSHPKAPTRPGPWGAAGEVLSRTANGRGHRQAATRLRAGQGAAIAGKTVPETTREMGISRGIRRECVLSR